MAQQQLTFANLKEFDHGRLASAFDLVLQTLIADCTNRPGLKGDREITLKLALKPLADPEGQLEDVILTYRVSQKAPARQSKPHTLNARRSPKGGMLVFEDSGDDANQPPLFDE